MTATGRPRRTRKRSGELRRFSVRLETSVYDRYCREALRTGDSVRTIICRVAAEPKKRGGAPSVDPTRVVTVILPASVLRRYQKRARLTGEPALRILRRILANYAPRP